MADFDVEVRSRDAPSLEPVSALDTLPEIVESESSTVEDNELVVLLRTQVPSGESG